MRRNRLIYVLTFSLALNCATVAAFVFFWWQSQTLAAVSVGQKSISGFLREDLNLTKEQSSRVLSRIDRSKQEAADLRASMDAKRAEMIGLITSNPVNKDAVREKMNEINHIQAQVRSAAVETVIAILESLPPDARDKFGAYVQERGRACDVCCPPPSNAGKAPSGR